MKTIRYRLEQVLILLAHLLLLKWIIYALTEGGTVDTTSLLLHFLGMALYGSLLIAFCAWRAKRRYRNEMLERNSKTISQ